MCFAMASDVWYDSQGFGSQQGLRSDSLVL